MRIDVFTSYSPTFSSRYCDHSNLVVFYPTNSWSRSSNPLPGYHRLRCVLICTISFRRNQALFLMFIRVTPSATYKLMQLHKVSYFFYLITLGQKMPIMYKQCGFLGRRVFRTQSNIYDEVYFCEDNSYRKHI